jgi:hypothetical protein
MTSRNTTISYGLALMLAAAGWAACTTPHEKEVDSDLDVISVAAGDCDDSNPELGLAPFDGNCDGTFKRMTLHEVFGGSTCGPCGPADELILDVLHQNEGAYVLLAYQVGSDPYVTSEGVSRRTGYIPPPSDGSYSIPWLQVDGENGFHPVEMNDDEGYTDADFDVFAAEPCQLGMEIDVTLDGQTVDASVTLLPGDDYDSEHLVLHVAIIEDVTYLNIGTNGQTEFHHVMKKMVPDQNGQSIAPLVRAEPVSFDQSWTFQGDYDDSTGITNMVDHASAHTVEDFAGLSVIAFVQDSQTLQIHQSIWRGQ